MEMDVDDDTSEEAEIGIIETLHLKNFMCHSDYKVEFGPRVNIILGRNGSGKSSLLSAIQIALGGKASSCGRALVLKNTVQRGKPFAELSITLRNRGLDAFRPEEYGDKITIERKITAEGASSYKLKNSDGHVVSSKKEDLTAILDTFNIQVQNPVAILTQEMSKTFLNHRNSKEKYNLFLQATQLERLENVYKDIEGHAKSVDTILELKESKIESLKSDIVHLEKEKDIYESYDRYKDQLADLYNEFLWSDVNEKEQLIEELATLLKQKGYTLEDASTKKKETEKLYADVVARDAELDQLYKKLHQETDTLSAQSTNLMSQGKDLQNSIRVDQGHLDAHDREITAKATEVQALGLNATEIRLQSDKISQKDNCTKENEISSCKVRIMAHEKEFAMLQQKYQAARNELEQKQREYSTKSEDLKILQRSCYKVGKQLEKLEQFKYNRMAAYGKNMPALKLRIKEDVSRGIFKKEPIGPLGLYVEVKERKWTLAAECCLGRNLLRSFLCDNVQDQHRLLDIMTELYPNQSTPQVITSPFSKTVYDVSFSRVYSNQYPCILDVIDVKEPAVLNCLIDQRGIENILVIPVADTAREIMMKNPPPQCNEVITAKGNSVFPYPAYRFYMNRTKTATLISSNTEEDIVAKRQVLGTLRVSYEENEKAKGDLNDQLSCLEAAVQQIEVQMQQCISLLNRECAKIKTLEDFEIADAASAAEADLQESRNTLKNLQDERIIQDQQLKEKKQQLNNIRNQIESKKVEHSEKKREMDKILLQKTKLRTKLDRVFRENGDALSQYRSAETEYKSVKDEYQRQLAIKEEKLKTASNACPRIMTNRKPTVVEASIDEVKSLIEEAKKRFPAAEENFTTLMRLRAEYHGLKQEIKRIRDTTKRLRIMMKERLESFNHIRLCTCMRVKYLFTTSLHPLKYIAGLKFDHQNRSIDINVQMEKQYGAYTVCLSGGEKSFVTVALLLALWDAVELPFRIMDEYDVFMDPVNRKRSMDLMLSTARANVKNQFVFFSPQRLPHMKSAEHIRILSLPNPAKKAIPQRKKRKCRD